MEDYRLIADTLAADIVAGRLGAGERLPPQRAFARQHGIAGSTAARVYGELIRRGLAVGEVGRGTFVRAGTPRPAPQLAEPTESRADLELVFPLLADQPALIADSLSRLTTPQALAAALPPGGAAGTAAAREAAAALVSGPGRNPDPDSVLFAGSGRQAIAAALSALVSPGERLGVEALTYPVVKGIAARLGITLVPLAVDTDGPRVDALRAAHRSAPLRAVYLQPALHNPLGHTMPPRRLAEVAATLREMEIPAVEDAVYGFLHDEPSLASQLPEATVVVDSLSKRVAPGLTIGILEAPRGLYQQLAAALRSGGWTAPRFAMEAACQLIIDGTAENLARAKRHDVALRHDLVRAELDGFRVRADPRAYHCWWRLPDQWRAETFVAAAARRGIAVTPAAAFTVETASAPHAVRLALASPTHTQLGSALRSLAQLARSSPENEEATE